MLHPRQQHLHSDNVLYVVVTVTMETICIMLTRWIVGGMLFCTLSKMFRDNQWLGCCSQMSLSVFNYLLLWIPNQKLHVSHEYFLLYFWREQIVQF